MGQHEEPGVGQLEQTASEVVFHEQRKPVQRGAEVVTSSKQRREIKERDVPIRRPIHHLADAFDAVQRRPMDDRGVRPGRDRRVWVEVSKIVVSMGDGRGFGHASGLMPKAWHVELLQRGPDGRAGRFLRRSGEGVQRGLPLIGVGSTCHALGWCRGPMKPRL